MFKSVLKSSILASSLLLTVGCAHKSNDALSQENDRVQTTKPKKTSCKRAHTVN